LLRLVSIPNADIRNRRTLLLARLFALEKQIHFSLGGASHDGGAVTPIIFFEDKLQAHSVVSPAHGSGADGYVALSALYLSSGESKPD
jgi:hypothetical protein